MMLVQKQLNDNKKGGGIAEIADYITVLRCRTGIQITELVDGIGFPARLDRRLRQRARRLRNDQNRGHFKLEETISRAT